MILEISSALISICNPRRSTRALSAARGVALLRISQSLLQRRELRRHAAVVDRASDPGHHSADQCRIDRGRQRYRSSDRRAEPLLQLRHPIGRQRRRRGDLGLNDLEVLHHALVEHRHQIGEQFESVALSQQKQQFADRARRLQPVENLTNDRLLAGGGTAGLASASRRSACACTRSEKAVSSFSACSGVDSVSATSNSALAYRAAEARVLMFLVACIYRRTSDAERALKGTSNRLYHGKLGF